MAVILARAMGHQCQLRVLLLHGLRPQPLYYFPFFLFFLCTFFSHSYFSSVKKLRHFFHQSCIGQDGIWQASRPPKSFSHPPTFSHTLPSLPPTLPPPQ